MSGSREFADHLMDMLGSESGIELRRYFGGWALRHEGKQLAMVMDTLYLRTELLDLAGVDEALTAPFQYQAKGRTVVVKGYRSVPASYLEEPGELRCLLNV